MKKVSLKAAIYVIFVFAFVLSFNSACSKRQTVYTNYKADLGLQGKRIGILTKFSASQGREKGFKAALGEIVGQAFAESDCFLVKAAQSMKIPEQFILYEEWTDYDEFYKVQVNKPYRIKFYETLAPISAKPADIEFFEIFHSVQDRLYQVNMSERFVAIASQMHPAVEVPKWLRKLKPMVSKVVKHPKCLALTVHTSIDNPGLILNFEEWVDYDYFVNVWLENPMLAGFKNAMQNPEKDSKYSLKFYQIFNEYIK